MLVDKSLMKITKCEQNSKTKITNNIIAIVAQEFVSSWITIFQLRVKKTERGSLG